MTTNWEKFKLLMWKNWLLSTRHKYPLLIELLVPLVFSGVLVMIRTLVHPTEIHTITRYPQMDTAAYLNSFKYTFFIIHFQCFCLLKWLRFVQN